jgi:hypothetical protein
LTDKAAGNEKALLQYVARLYIKGYGIWFRVVFQDKFDGSFEHNEFLLVAGLGDGRRSRADRMDFQNVCREQYLQADLWVPTGTHQSRKGFGYWINFGLDFYPALFLIARK